MSIDKVTCLVVKCDSCGDGWDSVYDDRGTPHFIDVQEAEKYAFAPRDPEEGDSGAGFVRDGAAVFCHECANKRLCASQGHDWREWRPCYCGGRIEGHRVVGAEVRYCERTGCPATEQRERTEPCTPLSPPVPQSRGAVLVQHRRNHELWIEARPEDAEKHGSHEVPDPVADLVAEAAALVARIDEALPDEYVVR